MECIVACKRGKHPRFQLSSLRVALIRLRGLEDRTREYKTLPSRSWSAPKSYDHYLAKSRYLCPIDEHCLGRARLLEDVLAHVMEDLRDFHPCTPPGGKEYFSSDIRLECTKFLLGDLTFLKGPLHVYQDTLNTESVVRCMFSVELYEARGPE